MAKFFVTGASGYVGSAVTRKLVERGDQIVALSRSVQSDGVLNQLGAVPLRGSVADFDVLRRGCESVDGAIYMAQWVPEEQEALATIAKALRGGEAPLLFTSGASMVAEETEGRFSANRFAEDAIPTPPKGSAIRIQSEDIVRQTQDVRGFAIRPGLVFGDGYSGQVDLYVQAIRQHGVVGIVGPGDNHWGVVHRDDLAVLYLAALGRGTAGGLYHAVAGEVRMGDVGHAVAEALGCPTEHWTIEEAADRYGKFQARVMLGSSCRPLADFTAATLGYRPTRTDLIDEITGGSIRR